MLTRKAFGRVGVARTSFDLRDIRINPVYGLRLHVFGIDHASRCAVACSVSMSDFFTIDTRTGHMIATAFPERLWIFSVPIDSRRHDFSC